MEHYRDSQLPHDEPMKTLISANQKLHRRIWEPKSKQEPALFRSWPFFFIGPITLDKVLGSYMGNLYDKRKPNRPPLHLKSHYESIKIV